MVKRIIAITTLFIVFVFAACSNNDNGDVKKALDGFFDGMYARDFQKARQYATPESEEVIGLLQSLAHDLDEAEKEEKPTISVKDIKIEHDTLATAMVQASTQPNTVKMTLKKRDAKWLIAFDLRSLAVMLGQDPDAAGQEMPMPPVTQDSL